RIDEPEQDLDQRALAGAVRADEADGAPVDVDRESVERGDAAGVALCQCPGRDEWHPKRVPEAAGPPGIAPLEPIGLQFAGADPALRATEQARRRLAGLAGERPAAQQSARRDT